MKNRYFVIRSVIIRSFPLLPPLPSLLSPFPSFLLSGEILTVGVRLLNDRPGQRSKELQYAVTQWCGWGENLREH